MRTVRYSIIESDLAENGIVGSMRFAEELVKSPYGSPELWDALSSAINLAEEQIKKIDSDINEIHSYIAERRDKASKSYFIPEQNFDVELSQIRELKAKKTAYMLMRENLMRGAQAAMKAIRGFVLDNRIDADPYVGVGAKSRKELLEALDPKDAEDLLKKLSDMTLLNMCEVQLYLMRQKRD